MEDKMNVTGNQSNQLTAAAVCAEFCPLGQLCNEGYIGPALAEFVDRGDDLEEGVDLNKLRQFVEWEHVPRKIGEVLIDGISREIYECPIGDLILEDNPKFIF